MFGNYPSDHVVVAWRQDYRCDCRWRIEADKYQFNRRSNTTNRYPTTVSTFELDRIHIVPWSLMSRSRFPQGLATTSPRSLRSGRIWRTCCDNLTRPFKSDNSLLRLVANGVVDKPVSRRLPQLHLVQSINSDLWSDVQHWNTTDVSELVVDSHCKNWRYDGIPRGFVQSQQTADARIVLNEINWFNIWLMTCTIGSWYPTQIGSNHWYLSWSPPSKPLHRISFRQCRTSQGLSKPIDSLPT